MTQMISKTQAPVKRAGRIDPIAFFERFGVLIFMILHFLLLAEQHFSLNAIFSTS
jgi:inositol transport system permease protein